MKLTLFITALAVLGLTVGSAHAQVPSVAVYFDDGLTMRAMDCPGAGTVSTLYVVAEDFGAYLIGMEFKIDYPPSMTWLADLNTPPVTVGASPTGISMGYALPQDAYQSMVCMTALVMWNCTDCSTLNEPLTVVPHPVFDAIQGCRWPDYVLLPGLGGRSMVCQHVDLDIKPGSCRNPFNTSVFEEAQAQPRKGGVLPVAVLGSASFDVSEIDIESVRLEGIPPVIKGKGFYEDVSGLPSALCECPPDGADGYMDLKLKFNAREIAAAIGAGSGVITLTLTGNLLDGLPFEAADCIEVVGGGDGKEMEHPLDLSSVVLGAAYPNPFNPTTRFVFALPEAQRVRLAVYDVSGRLVEVILEGHREAGEHVVQWEAAGLPSGVYFYQLRTAERTLVKRMTLLK